MSKGKFNAASYRATAEQTNSDKPDVELEIILVDGEIHSYSDHQMDSLAKATAHIAQNNIKNLEAYDWITITFETSNGNPPSDSSKKSVYVFRPGDVR